MKLYHVSQDKNNDYDTYSDFVICIASEEEARHTIPYVTWDDGYWCRSPEQVTVVYLGEADSSITPGIICASFHPG